MNNEKFLIKIKESFNIYLRTGSRSNEKLKILHGCIAEDLASRLGDEYIVHSLGYRDGKEKNVTGRYMNKKVDISIEKNNEMIASIGLKFIMRNYTQNSNNYFENMLGETANIRSNGKPYFQILVLPSKIPYFNKNGIITKYETVAGHNLSKYIKLSNDNTHEFMHTPDKTLLYLVDMPVTPNSVKNNAEYIEHYQNNNLFNIMESAEPYGFGNSIIYNDYNDFIRKITHYIKFI